MANHEITFDRFGDITVKVASDNFSFTILYHELYTGRYFVHQSEFLVISDYWKVTDIRLVRLNDKDYIEYKGAIDKRFCRLTELNYKIPRLGVISSPAASISCRSFFISSATTHLFSILTVLTLLRLRTMSIGANLLVSPTALISMLSL